MFQHGFGSMKESADTRGIGLRRTRKPEASVERALIFARRGTGLRGLEAVLVRGVEIRQDDQSELQSSVERIASHPKRSHPCHKIHHKLLAAQSRALVTYPRRRAQGPSGSAEPIESGDGDNLTVVRVTVQAEDWHGQRRGRTIRQDHVADVKPGSYMASPEMPWPMVSQEGDRYPFFPDLRVAPPRVSQY